MPPSPPSTPAIDIVVIAGAPSPLRPQPHAPPRAASASAPEAHAGTLAEALLKKGEADEEEGKGGR